MREELNTPPALSGATGLSLGGQSSTEVAGPLAPAAHRPGYGKVRHTGKKSLIRRQMKMLSDTCQKNSLGFRFFQAPKFNPQKFFPEHHTAPCPQEQGNLHLKSMDPTP